MAESLTVTAAKDTYMRQSAATTNYGNSYLEVYSTVGAVRRSILEFSLAGIAAGSTIVSAVMSIYKYDQSSTSPVGRTYWAYKLTRTDWVEAQATWNIYKTSNNWSSAGGDFVTSNPSGGSAAVPANNNWQAFTITDIVIDAFLAGASCEVIVVDSDEAAGAGIYSDYRSRETGGSEPKLVITYNLPVVAGGKTKQYISAGIL
jgi:hypothetical protein